MMMDTLVLFSKITLLCLLLWFSLTVHAADFVVEAGLHFGGDQMAQAIFTTGSTDKLQAGELISFSVGTSMQLSETIQSRLTFGIKMDEISATNGYIAFERYPLDLVFLYQTMGWGFGGGLTYHFNPSLDASGIAADFKADFDDALGLLAEVDWFFSKQAYLGFRYTAIEYKSVPSATANAATVDGNSMGIVLGASF